MSYYGNDIDILIDQPKDKKWFNDAHVHLCLEWLLRNDDHCKLQQVHVIPVNLSKAISSYVDEEVGGNYVNNMVHTYFLNNIDIISKRFIIMMMELPGGAWAVAIVVNPYIHMGYLLNAKLDSTEQKKHINLLAV